MFLFIGSPLFGLVALTIGVVQVLVLLFSNRLIRPLAKQELLTEGKFQGYAAEALVGVTTLKAAGAEQRALERWANLFFEQMNASVRRNVLSAVVTDGSNESRGSSPLCCCWSSELPRC